MKKHRETSKMLLWTIIALSAVFSVAALVLSCIFGELGVTITVIGGLWGASVPVVIGCYSDKAKTENEIKLSQNAEIEQLRAEIEALRGEQAPKSARKAPKSSANDALVGQIRLLLEQVEMEQ